MAAWRSLPVLQVRFTSWLCGQWRACELGRHLGEGISAAPTVIFDGQDLGLLAATTVAQAEDRAAHQQAKAERASADALPLGALHAAREDLQRVAVHEAHGGHREAAADRQDLAFRVPVADGDAVEGPQRAREQVQAPAERAWIIRSANRGHAMQHGCELLTHCTCGICDAWQLTAGPQSAAPPPG